MECPECHTRVDEATTKWCLECGLNLSEGDRSSTSLGALALLGATGTLLSVLVGVYSAGYQRQSGVFLLLSMVAFGCYLMLDEQRRVRSIDRAWARWDRWVTRGTAGVAGRADTRRAVGRERRALQHMRDERQRRITTLGEHAYRFLRTRELTDEFRAAADRVRRIEEMMIAQEQRVRDAATRPHSDTGNSAPAPVVAAPVEQITYAEPVPAVDPRVQPGPRQQQPAASTVQPAHPAPADDDQSLRRRFRQFGR